MSFIQWLAEYCGFQLFNPWHSSENKRTSNVTWNQESETKETYEVDLVCSKKSTSHEWAFQERDKSQNRDSIVFRKEKSGRWDQRTTIEKWFNRPKSERKAQQIICAEEGVSDSHRHSLLNQKENTSKQSKRKNKTKEKQASSQADFNYDWKRVLRKVFQGGAFFLVFAVFSVY